MIQLPEPETRNLGGMAVVAELTFGETIVLDKAMLKRLRIEKFLSQKHYIAFALFAESKKWKSRQKTLTPDDMDSFCDRWQIDLRDDYQGKPIIFTAQEVIAVSLWLQKLDLGEVRYEQLTLDIPGL